MTDQVPDPRGLRVVAHRQNFVTSVKYAGWFRHMSPPTLVYSVRTRTVPS